jgi:glucose-1-phosphate thymidylyltransferase
MNVIIPAAGIGSRLRPHTHTLPKALLHVAGKPILGHILDIITRLDADEISVVTGFMGDDVEKYVRNRYNRPIRFVRQEELLGLGYAVHLALAGLDDRPVLILLGDTIVETDLPDFISRGDNVLGLLPVDNPQRFGIADVAEGVVTRLVEKPDQPQSNLAIIGLYYISTVAGLRKHLDRMIASNQKNHGEFQLTDALQAMIEDGVRFVPYSVDGWYDCGECETLINTNRHLLERL